MSDICLGSMGKNSDGDDGHTTLTFTNRAEADEFMTVVVWLHTADYVSSFVNVHPSPGRCPITATASPSPWRQ
ncbi:hypothetical protein CRV24_005069 [Beauveria bassiana]|nr:hypothetical protein CRV24_005069 [Beauveria bassiana]KAH8711709.1 hypothetical protein HC256_008524 [Beauveria bassiana]